MDWEPIIDHAKRPEVLFQALTAAVTLSVVCLLPKKGSRFAMAGFAWLAVCGIALAHTCRCPTEHSVFKPADPPGHMQEHQPGDDYDDQQAPHGPPEYPLEFAEANGLTALAFHMARHKGRWVEDGHGGLIWTGYANVLHVDTPTGRWYLSPKEISRNEQSVLTRPVE